HFPTKTYNLSLHDALPIWIGIAESELHMLFKKFSKIEGVGFTEGRGLGLYLSRLIVEGHGGHVEVSSSPAGSVFTISIPAKKARSEEHTSELQSLAYLVCR